MFGFGFMELCVIAVVTLIFVGPQRLPELMRQAGKFFVQLRRMSSEIKYGFDSVVQEAESEIQKVTQDEPIEKPKDKAPSQVIKGAVANAASEDEEVVDLEKHTFAEPEEKPSKDS